MQTQKNWFSIQDKNDQEESLSIPHGVDEFDYAEEDWEPDEDELEAGVDVAVEDDWELDGYEMALDEDEDEDEVIENYNDKDSKIPKANTINNKVKKSHNGTSKAGEYKALLNLILLVPGLPLLFLIIAINVTGLADKSAGGGVEKEAAQQFMKSQITKINIMENDTGNTICLKGTRSDKKCGLAWHYNSNKNIQNILSKIQITHQQDQWYIQTNNVPVNADLRAHVSNIIEGSLEKIRVQ